MSDMKLSEQLQRDFGEIEECAQNQKGYAEKAKALEDRVEELENEVIDALEMGERG